MRNCIKGTKCKAVTPALIAVARIEPIEAHMDGNAGKNADNGGLVAVLTSRTT